MPTSLSCTRRRKPITAYTHDALKKLTYEQRLEVPGYAEAFDAAARRERELHPDPFEGLAEPGPRR